MEASISGQVTIHSMLITSRATNLSFFSHKENFSRNCLENSQYFWYRTPFSMEYVICDPYQRSLGNTFPIILASLKYISSIPTILKTTGFGQPDSSSSRVFKSQW
jgi:hypothetical protein